MRAALAAVVLALVWSAAWWYVPPIVAARAQEAAARDLGRNLALGRITFQPWTLELTIEELALAGPSEGAPPLFAARRVYADLALVSLLRLAPVVDRLEIDAPMLRVARIADGRSDFDDVVQHVAALPDSGPLRFSLHNIVVRDGGADFVDRPLAKTHALRSLELTVPFISSLPSERTVEVDPHLAFMLDGSRFDSAASATPFAERGNGELHAKLDDFAVAPYLGYLPRGLPAQLRAATLNAELVVAFEQRPKLSLNVRGVVGAKGIEIVDAAAKELLEIGNVQVRIDELRPLERSARLQRIDIDAPHLVASRNAAGAVNLLLAAESPAGAAVPVARVPVPGAKASAPAAASASAAAPSADAAAPWKIALAALSLRAGRVDWSDATTSPAAALALDGVSFDAQSIAWPLATPVAFRGEGLLGAGSAHGKLAFSGQGDGDGAAVKVSLASLPLAPLRPYLQSVLAPPLAGELSADVDLDWRAGSGAPRLKLVARRLALANAVLGAAGAPEAAAELIEVSDARIDTSERSANIGRLALRAPRVRVERDAKGAWDFARWIAAAPAAAPSPSPAPKPWRLALAELAVEGGRFGFIDRAAPAPVAFDVVDLAAQLRGYALESAAPAPFRVSARVTVPAGESGKAAGSGVVGSIDARGELGAFAAGVPARAQAKLVAKDLPLHLLRHYLDPLVDIEVQKAQTSFRGDVRWSSSHAGASVSVAGDATIDEFRATNSATGRGAQRSLAMVRDAGSGRQLVNWKSMTLRGIALHTAPGTAMRLSVAETTVSDFFARVELDENGRLNLQDVARSTPGAAGPAPIVSFGPIALVGGRLRYNDRFVKPNYNANISELTGHLGAFSSEPAAPGQPPELADLSLRGVVEQTASLEIEGKVNPLASPLALDLRAKVRDLELPPLSPYAIKYAGYGIERGKMSVDLAYVVQPNGELSATNKIVLNQLAFGDKAQESTASLPVKLAVALLADRHGVIDLDLPVSGSINDPQFSLGGVIWKAISNLIVKAVSAPFALLASASGGGSELSRIEFAPGTATLDADARDALDKIAKALADRPALTLTISGESRLDRERDAWKKERLAQILRAEKRRQAIAAGASPSAQVTVSEAEVPALLKEVYRRADIVKPKNVFGMAKDLPPAEMEALLLASIVVADDAMQQLAVRRGVAVRDYLVSREIAAERLFLGAPKVASGDAEWTPRADLKLAAS